MSRSRHNEATDRLAAALAERLPAGWEPDPGADVTYPGGDVPDLGGDLLDPGDTVREAEGSEPRHAGRDLPSTATTTSSRAGRHARAEVAGSPSWVRVPTGLAQARLASARPAVLALIAVVVGVVAIFGVRLVRAQEPGAPVASGEVVGSEEDSANGASGSGTAGSGASTFAAAGPTGGAGTAAVSAGGSASPGAPALVVVHVVGQVRHPGVVDLPTGSRVVDAIKQAGGARSGADLGAVNLARLVVDGEQIIVPKPGQSLPSPPPAGQAGGSGGATPGAAGAGGAAVNINTADIAGLDTLPGVGPVLAGRILAWRTEHGRFTAVDELGEVSGIGEKLLAQLRPLVTV
ncbi:MAG: ComEA family DNA-binding protein [Tetrasphaera sp.]